MCVLRQVSVHLNLIRPRADLCMVQPYAWSGPPGLAFPRARCRRWPPLHRSGRRSHPEREKKNVVQMGGMMPERDGDRLRSCSALARRSVPVLSCAAAAAAGSEWYVIDQEGRKLVRICFFFSVGFFTSRTFQMP